MCAQRMCKIVLNMIILETPLPHGMGYLKESNANFLSLSLSGGGAYPVIMDSGATPGSAWGSQKVPGSELRSRLQLWAG